MRPSRITGLASYLPKNMVTNAQLAPLEPPHSLEELSRFGIRTRGHAGEDEEIVSMALRAAQTALRDADVSGEALDFILFANWTSRRFVPDIAPLIQEGLGARRAFALDLCGACCGFIFGLATAQSYLQNPRFRRGLVVASDHASRHMRPGSRATIVFGDAAAAAVVEAEADKGFQIADYELRSDGARHGIMEVDADGYLDPHIRQRELNELAGRTMAASASALLDRNHLGLDDIDHIVPHSGTAGVQRQLQEALGVDPEKVFTNLPEVGNVTSASIPCALRAALDCGKITMQDTVLTIAVGLGWHHVAMLLKP